MPILKRQPDIFPQGLFEEPAEQNRWWIAYLRSRQEKVLARYLRQRHVAHYLPTREKRRRRSGRVYRSFLPLFPGYLFLRTDSGGRMAALGSNVVVRMLVVRDQAQLEGELKELHRLQQTGAPLVPHPYLGPGDPVEIQDGPFKGYRGRVVRAKGPLRLVVSITLLKRAVAAEFDRESLTPLSASTGGRAARAAVG